MFTKYASRPWPRPRPGQAKPYFWLLAWLMILPNLSRLKPGQSQGFQAKPRPAHHYYHLHWCHDNPLIMSHKPNITLLQILTLHFHQSEQLGGMNLNDALRSGWGSVSSLIIRAPLRHGMAGVTSQQKWIFTYTPYFVSKTPGIFFVSV